MFMTEKETQNSAELDLRKLEIRVEELIRACSYLKDENKSLRARQDNLVAERAALIEKTELARARVEAMITRLKSMETPQ
jgi:cell division protein ZapB